MQTVNVLSDVGTRSEDGPPVLGLDPAPRSYQSWVADETIEDYALRYAPRGYRRWTPATIVHTALGGISFLALEAIGAVLTLSFGTTTTILAVLIATVFIFLTSLPIAYHAARSNVDMDLLTRGAGFGYIGSSVTSLIYLTYTVIFFALEGAIIAQALLVCFGLPLPLGYLLSTLAILPVAARGMTAISRFQKVTQAPWLILGLLPFAAIALVEPKPLALWLAAPDPGVTMLALGGAISVLCALTLQIGEQVDYLRFLPPKETTTPWRWWGALLMAGPGWILIGGLKIVMGSFLVTLAVAAGMDARTAAEPIGMFRHAFGYLFEPTVALLVATAYILIAQLKINVTNAYAGSLAGSNFFVRVARYHPGRLVWLVLHVTISCALMMLGLFATLEAVLAFYANLAMAWLGAILADLAVLKPLGLSPARIEFRRAHLPDFHPVGCGSMALGGLAGCALYLGLGGPVAQAWSPVIAFGTSVLAALAIAALVRGRGYLARRPQEFAPQTSCDCAICSHGYEVQDLAYCTFYHKPICSLCCSLEPHCRDYCKRPAPVAGGPTVGASRPGRLMPLNVPPRTGRRIWQVLAVFAALMAGLALAYAGLRLLLASGRETSLLPQLLFAALPLVLLLALWLVMTHERRRLTEEDLIGALVRLNSAQRELALNQRLAAIGEVAATISHELRNPLGTVAGSIEVLARSPGLGPEVAEDVDRARRNIRRCGRIIDMLLDFARQEPHERVVIEVEAWLAAVLADHSARGVARLTVDPGLRLHCDPARLQFAICNLLDNAMQAVEAADAPGFVPQIALRARRKGASVAIEVEDNGPGLDPNLLARAFDPLVTGRPRGVGLGLPLVRRVAHIHGGEVSIERSGPGGTLMRIALPAVMP
jgi:signal transduction histidine kinase